MVDRPLDSKTHSISHASSSSDSQLELFFFFSLTTEFFLRITDGVSRIHLTFLSSASIQSLSLTLILAFFFLPNSGNRSEGKGSDRLVVADDRRQGHVPVFRGVKCLGRGENWWLHRAADSLVPAYVMSELKPSQKNENLEQQKKIGRHESFPHAFLPKLSRI